MIMINVELENGRCCEIDLNDGINYPVKFNFTGIDSMSVMFYNEDDDELFTSEKGISGRND